jgi:NCS1 family nucleobase:cation symporter-1
MATDSATVESKSIDWIPLGERRGKPSMLFPLWFMSNANLTTRATGSFAVGPTVGPARSGTR